MSNEENVPKRRPGQFEPGNQASKNRGPNKVSSKVKEAIVGFLENNMDTIQEDFKKLKPRDRLKFISDILPYAAPKLSSINAEVSVPEESVKSFVIMHASRDKGK